MISEVHFKGQLSRELFLKAQRLHWKLRRLFVLIASAAMIVVGPLVWTAGPARIGGMVVLAAGVLGLISFALGPRRWSRIYDNTPYLKNEVRGVVSRASYTVETATGRNELPWSQFVRVAASDDFVLLYRGPNVFNCFAKCFFNTDDDWQKARSIALEMVKGSS